MSDADRALKWLETGKPLTPMDAFEQWGCYRLAARIWDLRKRGHTIETTIIEGTDRHGERSRWASYKLIRKGESE